MITRAAVIGAGYMGGGIAQMLALGGVRVLIADVDAESASRAKDRLVEQARLLESRGLMVADAAVVIGDHLHAATSIELACEEAEFILEAVPERLDIKIPILERISAAADPQAIIATNTSAIPIRVLAEGVHRPDRFIGVHFMNPAHVMPCVEIIPSEVTAEHAVDAAKDLMTRIGKSPIRVADSPGFVANRLQFALYREAALIVEEGLATAEDVDEVVRNAFGLRLAFLGPLTVGDMAGLDVYAGAFATLSDAFGERFSAPRVLLEAVERGHLGTKTGHGLTRPISLEEKAELERVRDEALHRVLVLREEIQDHR